MSIEDYEGIVGTVGVEAYSVDTADSVGIVAPAHSVDIVDSADTVGRIAAP